MILLQAYPLTSELTLKNRIVMAPMTRNMAQDDFSPTEAMVEYYGRRAAAGLIITEGCIIRADGRGYSHTPGIFTPAHIEAWKKVTEKVHHQDGRIFLQIWHVGRVSHPHFLNGALPLSPSETMMTGRVPRTEDLSYGKSRALRREEISSLVESYALAAESAVLAGFDGVEIHGANGYLIDQFLHYDTNHRDDDYGGSPENMAKFALEVVKACGLAIGGQKVGLRLSPAAYLNQIVGDPRDAAVFEYVLTKLNSLPLAYVHTGNFDDQVKFEWLGHRTMTGFIRDYYQGKVIASGGYCIEAAKKSIQAGNFDLIAIGRPWIANPDLIARLSRGQELRPYDASMLGELK